MLEDIIVAVRHQIIKLDKMKKILTLILGLATLGTAQAFDPQYPGRLVLLQQGAWDTLFLAGPVTHKGNHAEAWIVLQGRYDPGRDEHRVRVDCAQGHYQILETRRFRTDRELTEHQHYAQPPRIDGQPGTLAAAVRRICK